MSNPFATVPVTFAGIRPMHLTLHIAHLMDRWKTRMGKEFNNGNDCAKYMSACFRDPRLAVILEKAPRHSTIVLIFEEEGYCAFFTFGTAFDENEVKVNTVYPYAPGTRLLVDPDDLCYRLPPNGEKLHFGREKKCFEVKKRRKNI